MCRQTLCSWRCRCNFARARQWQREVRIDDWAGKVSAQIATTRFQSRAKIQMVEKWRSAPGGEFLCRLENNNLLAPAPHPCKSAASDLFALHRNYSRPILIFQGQILTRPGTIGSVVTQPTNQHGPPTDFAPNLCFALTNPMLCVAGRLRRRARRAQAVLPGGLRWQPGWKNWHQRGRSLLKIAFRNQ